MTSKWIIKQIVNENDCETNREEKKIHLNLIIVMWTIKLRRGGGEQ